MLIPLLMAFTQLGRWVAVLDVSARERARLPALDLLLNQSQGEMYISLDRTIGAHPVGA